MYEQPGMGTTIGCMQHAATTIQQRASRIGSIADAADRDSRVRVAGGKPIWSPPGILQAGSLLRTSVRLGVSTNGTPLYLRPLPV
jgi:hypothetical protein